MAASFHLHVTNVDDLNPSFNQKSTSWQGRRHVFFGSSVGDGGPGFQPLRLLPAGATVAGRDSHPLKNGAFHGAADKPPYVSFAIAWNPLR